MMGEGLPERLGGQRRSLAQIEHTLAPEAAGELADCLGRYFREPRGIVFIEAERASRAQRVLEKIGARRVVDEETGERRLNLA
jgi:hypothetical protein